MKEKSKAMRLVAVVVLALLLLYGCSPGEPFLAASYNCLVYTEQGCAKQIVASGGEIQVESGGTLDLQSGATVDLAGTFSSSGGAVTFSDNVLIDGAADAVQLTVQGHSTQNNNLFVAETSAGTDKFTIDNSGNVVVAGTSDLQGDVSDSVGDLTIADNLAVTGTVDISGTLQYGANNLYPVGYDTSGYQVVYGSDTITVATVTHGLTTVTWALCSLAEDPGTGGGEAAVCSVSVSTNVVTVKLWQDDFSAATVAALTNWLVIGLP